jgi:hypothetical protein
MSFEDLTLVPIQTKMINADLLTASEEQWLDSYHKLVSSCTCNSLLLSNKEGDALGVGPILHSGWGGTGSVWRSS